MAVSSMSLRPSPSVSTNDGVVEDGSQARPLINQATKPTTGPERKIRKRIRKIEQPTCPHVATEASKRTTWSRGREERLVHRFCGIDARHESHRIESDRYTRWNR